MIETDASFLLRVIDWELFSIMYVLYLWDYVDPYVDAFFMKIRNIVI